MTFEKVKKILVDELGAESEEITMESNIKEDLDADSLDVVQIVMAVEEAFELEIDEEAAEKILTVGDMVRYIDARR